MDNRIKVSKVDNVTLWRTGRKVDGTLHLQLHHLIFRYYDPAQPQPHTAQDKPPAPRLREMWVAYPMISRCTYRPSFSVQHSSPIMRFQCRDFTFFALHFAKDTEAREAYDTIRCLTCKVGSVERLYAFSYKSPDPEKAISGWNLYDPRREFKRMGISAKDTDKGWRISAINHDYQYSPTYPSLLAVPSVISDMTLKYARDFRSRARIPALVYLHPINNCSITRSSQPLPGLQRKRNPQDEKLIAAIFATSRPNGEAFMPDSLQPSPSSSPSHVDSPSQSTEQLPPVSGESSFVVADTAAEDHALASATNPRGRMYGAQQKNLIVDARPRLNATVNSAIGKGSEDMAHYGAAAKAYLGIANIHVMRNSLNKVVDALKHTDMADLPPSRDQLAKSGWLEHISLILDGARIIVRAIAIEHSHVLIHCSDGWDRTSQLSALAQICLDPYYRTMEGFIVLVEKDWLSFGHQFRQRSGLLNSEKWFEIENERIGGGEGANNGPAGSGNAFENALLSAKGFFGNKRNDSRESLVEPETEMKSGYESPNARSNGTPHTPEKGNSTKLDEVSPVFHQFLDAVYQLLCQHPTRFEFNDRFLKRLLYHLYSCQYGTFLFDNEKERAEYKAHDRTQSVWDFFLARKAMFMNERYDATVDDRVRGKERIFVPDMARVRWWAEVFGRKDEELNGPALFPNTQRQRPHPEAAEAAGPVLYKVESGNPATGETKEREIHTNESSFNGEPGLVAGFAALATGHRSPSPSANKSRTHPMEVELQ
ncbi:protein phosphatase [Phyllosticta citribraziliensis]|uniref:Protein phosphatase n=1 Tax=Phyllosticta citribraziliensis TaxID=989973 RepID=A0ABR1L8S4_9PEZI